MHCANARVAGPKNETGTASRGRFAGLAGGLHFIRCRFDSVRSAPRLETRARAPVGAPRRVNGRLFHRIFRWQDDRADCAAIDQNARHCIVDHRRGASRDFGLHDHHHSRLHAFQADRPTRLRGRPVRLWIDRRDTGVFLRRVSGVADCRRCALVRRGGRCASSQFENGFGECAADELACR